MELTLPKQEWREKKFEYPDDCGYWKVYEYQVPLECEGINFMSIKWAAENCKSLWGWYFTEHEKHAIMTFEDPEEMILWALRWQAIHRER